MIKNLINHIKIYHQQEKTIHERKDSMVVFLMIALIANFLVGIIAFGQIGFSPFSIALNIIYFIGSSCGFYKISQLFYKSVIKKQKKLLIHIQTLLNDSKIQKEINMYQKYFIFKKEMSQIKDFKGHDVMEWINHFQVYEKLYLSHCEQITDIEAEYQRIIQEEILKLNQFLNHKAHQLKERKPLFMAKKVKTLTQNL